ncbi:MAG: hypothetical protein O7B30_05270 [Thaumarchaeota archaeon]|nr:hypothetical protein [Nitrososphaerota archaeon]
MDSNLILDSTAFYAGIPFSSSEIMYTTPQVFDEIAKGKNVYLRVKGLIDSDRLRILHPGEKSIAKIKNSSQAIEGLGILSDADLSVVALAIEMAEVEPAKKTVIVTDDYAIQNVAANMHVEYRAVMTRGIRNKGSWSVYCPGCGREQEGEARVCEACGTKYRRRLITR